MRFIHISDVHMGMEPDRGMPWSSDRRQEIVDSLFRAVDECRNRNADLLLISGDLFHKQPLVKELKELNYAFSKINNTKVVIMAGNHDYMGIASHYRKFPWCSNVVMLNPYGHAAEEFSSAGDVIHTTVSANGMDMVEFEDIGTRIYGFSYEQRDITEPRYDNVHPVEGRFINILLAHGGDPKNVPIDKHKLAESGFDYIALGHIHKPEKFGERMAYAGSLEPLDRNETGAHGYFIGDITRDEDATNSSLSVNSRIRLGFVSFSKRKYIHIKVSVASTMTNLKLAGIFKKRMEELGSQNIYKWIILGYHDPDMIFDKEILMKTGNVVEIQDETVPAYDFEQLYADNKNNLIGMYLDAVKQKDLSEEVQQKALYYGLEALLKTEG